MDRGQFFFRPAGLVLKAVQRGNIDFAFINFPVKPPSVISQALEDDPAVIGGLRSKYAHIESAKSYRDLTRERWIHHEGRGRDWTESLGWDSPGFVVSDIYTMKFLILEGYGLYEFQLAYFSKEEQERLAIAKFPARYATNRIYAVWRRNISTNAKAALDALLIKLRCQP